MPTPKKSDTPDEDIIEESVPTISDEEEFVAKTSVKVSKKAVEEAEKLMKELLAAFELEAKLNIEQDEYDNAEGKKEEFIKATIEGENIGVLIGYLGRNLRSLQRVASAMLNRRIGLIPGGGEFVRFVIDVSGYRERRQETLEKMAERIREEVLVNHESVDLPPMTSYERRVIHTCLTKYDDVTTESFGEGADRHVKVLPR